MKKALPLLILAVAIYVQVGRLRPFPEWLPGILVIPADIVVPAGGDLQAAINASKCGDTIKLPAGASWEVPKPYEYDKKCGVGAELRIAGSGTLPNGRVSPSLASSMTRFRATSSGGVLQTKAGASGLILDGLEITDNATGLTVVNFLLDFGSFPGVTNITVQRSYIHPKEIGTTVYKRAAIRATEFEGSGLLWKWNYAAGFLGHQPDNQLPTTEVILCISCNNITVLDNYMQAWYAAIFTGGGGSNPQFTASLVNATTTSANYSQIAGLAPGIVQRFDLIGTATSDGSLVDYKDVVGDFKSTVVSRTGGTALVDFNATGTQQGYHIRFTPVGSTVPNPPVYRGRVKAVSGNNITVVWEYGQAAPAGSYTWTMWAAAQVKSVSGNAVTYEPYGPNKLLQAPTMPGQVAWRESAVVYGWKVIGNTIDTPYEYSVYEHDLTGNSPKGSHELKDMDGMLWEGNHLTGYPTAIGLSNRSNEGGTPWSTTRNITYRSNFFDYNLSTPSAIRQFMIAQIDDYSNSATRGENIVITNNLVRGVNVLVNSDAMDNSRISFNTIINDNINSNGNSFMFGVGPSKGLLVDSNIVANNEYGLNCQIQPYTRDMCWPGATVINNVVVNNKNVPLNTGSWGAGSILSPIPTSFDQVGFVNSPGNDYRLSASSPFKGRGTGGIDPGVNWTQLVTALGFDPSGVPVPTPSPTITPTPSPTPTATPTPTPTPSPSPTPSLPCVLTVPESVSIPRRSSRSISVTLNNLVGSATITTQVSSGQISISPTTRLVSGTSVVAEFLVSVKQNSGSVTFTTPCGVKSMGVVAQ